MQYVHDATVDAMNRGLDVWTAMHEIALPEQLELGEAYGRVDWSVRAIWETYAGWFHQHSTLDLYGAPPEQGASEIVALAGGADAVGRARRRARRIDPLTAVRLCELALATDPAHRGALEAYRRAHEQSARRARPRRTSGSPAGSRARSGARPTDSLGSTPT